MFSYHGSKKSIIKYYPKPEFDTIIEPFAGSASYAFRYFDKNVILIDKYDVIVKVWRYLQQASEKDILSLPSLKNGGNLKDFNLSEAERYLIYFCGTGGGAGVTGWKIRQKFSRWHSMKSLIAKNLWKIRHWTIIHGEYSCVETKATWFIDPPYISKGYKYKFNNKKLDFNLLATWIKSRKGQIIVCEESSANWLPFVKLANLRAVNTSLTTEVFWTNREIEVQQNLF